MAIQDRTCDETEAIAPEINGPALLEVSDLAVDFRSSEGIVPAVQGVSFSIAEGQTLAIVGESGSGKSVTARAILGLHPRKATSVSGSVKFEGRELVGLSDDEMRHVRGRSLALVFQDPMRSLNPTMRVGDQLCEAIRVHERVPRIACEGARPWSS